MGVSNLENIASSLMKAGKDKYTPVAIINWASRYNQKVITSTLEDIVQTAKRENIKPPSLIVVGDVVKLRDKLNFFENKPLFGKNIVVTRARAQNSSLVEKMLDMGANVIECPSIKINEIQDSDEIISAINNLEKYTHIIFTSQNGVNIFFDKLMNLNIDIRKITQKIVSIGPATTLSLKEKGIIADYMPDKYVAEGIFEMIKDKLKPSDNILIPRAKESRDFLVKNLKNICKVQELHIYETTIDEESARENSDLLDRHDIDYITFTSSSTVKNFMKIIGKNDINSLKSAKIISIGPITSNTIKSYELDVYKECQNYTIDEILKIITNDIGEE